MPEQRIGVLTFEQRIVSPGETVSLEAASPYEGEMIGQRLIVEAFRADGRQVVDGVIVVAIAHSDHDRIPQLAFHFRKGERSIVTLRNGNPFEIWVGLAMIGVVTLEDSNENDVNPLRKTAGSQ